MEWGTYLLVSRGDEERVGDPGTCDVLPTVIRQTVVESISYNAFMPVHRLCLVRYTPQKSDEVEMSPELWLRNAKCYGSVPEMGGGSLPVWTVNDAYVENIPGDNATTGCRQSELRARGIYVRPLGKSIYPKQSEERRNPWYH
jgi:hypothetical protein